MIEFMNMGGYGAFVWPCFALAAIVLVWNVVAARRLHAAARQRLMRRVGHGGGRTMTPRRKRLLAVVAILAGVGAATALAMLAFQDNLLYFYNPSQVLAGDAPSGRTFRIGGMVTEGSLKRTEGTLQVRFVVTDYQHSIPVSYEGLLPDLFREGQGVIAHGKLSASGEFVADEVLAKHDENYMPPEVAESLHTPTPARVSE